MSEEYDLVESKKKLGALIPVIKDAHGHVIDGFHRLDADPDWPSVTLDHIQDSVQLTVARLASNVCRRQVPAEEKTKLLAEIAKLTDWSPKEIAENLGMKHKWVLQYLPDEYKRAEGYERIPRRGIQSPQVVSAEPTETEPMPVAPQAKEPVECSSPNCQVGTWFPYRLKDGRVLCRSCFEKLWLEGKVTKDDLLQESQTETESQVSREREPSTTQPATEPPTQPSQPPAESEEPKRFKITVSMQPLTYYEKYVQKPTKEQLMERMLEFVESRSLDDRFEFTVEQEEA